MDKPLAYIDQNVIGLLLEGHISLSNQSEFAWVYSKEHFAEIRRSSNSEPYLSSLERIGAKLLDLELDSDWEFTGNAKLIESATPHQHYKAYIETTSEVDISENLFDPFLVWVNGGCDEGPLRDLPEQLAIEILNSTKDFPDENEKMRSQLNDISPQFTNLIDQIIEHGNDISKTRKGMGDGKGVIGGIEGKKKIQQIWEIIAPACPGVTCDRFFGFDPLDKQGHESWPIYLGIVGCCAVMDIIGFQAEKKCRKLDKLPNIRSDAGHIAMGSFCSAILSVDKRLIGRARAIYEYKNIGTSALLIERQANNSIKRDC